MLLISGTEPSIMSVKLNMVSLINQPQCNYPSFDTIIDQNHSTEYPVVTTKYVGSTNEGVYGVIKQPQCEDINLAIIMHDNNILVYIYS